MASQLKRLRQLPTKMHESKHAGQTTQGLAFAKKRVLWRDQNHGVSQTENPKYRNYCNWTKYY